VKSVALARLDSIDPAIPAKVGLRGEKKTVQPSWLTEAIVASVHGERGHLKNIASEIGVSYEMARRVADQFDTHPLRAHWIPTIVRETHSYAILDALEAQVGRVAFAIPVAHTSDHVDVVLYTQTCVKEFGDILTRVGTSLSDGTLTTAECDECDQEIDDLIAAAAAFKALLRQKAVA
jgi:hypothetical protein